MANLVELFDNIVQMQNLNGVPLAAGKLYVYALGRTRLMDSWSDVDGESLNPNPIILDDAGQAHVYVSDDFDYTLVVCDQYNNEIFSLDKYLYSKGSHSHADVAVAPSESIAVSSYHVGETTVYVPYLTGQLGKVYEGIDPIVVNNQVDKISANHVPLGVQEPLYFVQDDEEACIIGCSAQTEIPSELSGKWDEASDAVIANSAQWAEGTEYEAGSYVDINGHTINVTGLQPAGNYQSAGDYVVHDELSSYATQDWVENQSYMKEYMKSAFYPSTSNPSGYLTAHQDISNKLDTTAFSTVSGDFLTAIPSEYVTENTLQSGLSSKLDSTAFSTVSGNFLTAHQSLDGLMSADLLEISDNKITGYNGTAFAGQGGGVTGDFELSAGSGISIVDYPLEQKTVISVTAQGGNPEVEQAVIDNSATWNTVSDKLDTTAFSDVSGTFLTAHQDLSNYQTTAGMTAYQPAGDYLTTADSAEFYTTANESGFITGVDLTPYQLTANMTAYQPTGDYLTTADSANFYTTANESGFITNDAITGKQDITGMTAYQPVGDYVQGSDLSLNSYDKISAISGHEIAVEELPEGVMVESGLEYDNTEISGYSGSAFKDVALTDVVTANSGAWGGSALPISAGPGIKFEMVDNTLVARTDETILFFAGNDSSGAQTGNLTESIMNFERIRVAGMDNDGHVDIKYIYPAWTKNADNFDATGYEVMLYGGNPINNTVWEKWTRYSFSALTSFNVVLSYEGSYTANSISDVTNSHKNSIREVVGINRIAGE